MKVSRQKALSDWEKELLRDHYAKDPGPPPETESKTYKDNSNNEWLKSAVLKICGPNKGAHKKLAILINRSPTYIYNVMRGYYPMSKELENLINLELEKER